MRINVKQQILDYEGKPLMANKVNIDGSPVLDDDGRTVKEPEKLRDYLVAALNNTIQGEVLTPEQKMLSYRLTTRLYKTKEVNLTSEDIVLIKDRVGKIFGPLVLGRVSDMLEGNKIVLPEPDDEGEKEGSDAATGSRKAS
jgi:hypothetical protein